MPNVNGSAREKKSKEEKKKRSSRTVSPTRAYRGKNYDQKKYRKRGKWRLLAGGKSFSYERR